MHKKTIIAFLFSIAYLISITCISQQTVKSDQYHAINWSVEDGLPFDGMNVVIKDKKGFLWVGTGYGGLCRFDGLLFKKYLPDTNKRGSVYSDLVLSFVEDSLKNIWIGTNRCLSRYDVKADTFTNLSAISDASNFRSSVRPFWATKDDIFCVESDEWITSYNIHSLKGKRLQKISKETEFINNYSIYEQATNCVWLPRGTGIQPGALTRINLNNGKKEIYKWPCYKNNNPAHRHNFEAMQYDPKRNSIWLNTGDGLLQFSLIHKNFTHIDALNKVTQLNDFDRDAGIAIDRSGRIWLSTKPKGIYIYDPKTDKAEQIFSDPNLQKK